MVKHRYPVGSVEEGSSALPVLSVVSSTTSVAKLGKERKKLSCSP